MTHQYESEILNKLMERDGFNIPSSVPPYEAEIKAYLINQVKQAYPKLTDYEAEWLLYNYTKHLPADFPISSVSNVTEASFENVVPFAYQSAILKGNTKYRDIDTGDILDTFDETKNLELVSVKLPVLTTYNLKRIIDFGNITYTTPPSRKVDVTLSENTVTVTDISNTSWTRAVSEKIQLESNEKYTIAYDIEQHSDNTEFGTRIFDSTDNTISVGDNKKTYTFTTPSDGIIKVSFYANLTNVINKKVVTYKNINLVKGTTAKPLTEPFKSNILTVNEPIELRGIGDVQDTLNLLTGEVTERIGEIVLDGSENWSKQGVSQNNSDLGIYYSTKALPNTIFNTINVLCDKFKTSKTMAWHSSEEDIYVSVSTYGLKICFDERKLESTTVEGFKKWLSENTPTIQYPLVEKPIKTVDLKTVNESGESVHFMPIEGTMYVQSSGEIIQPSFDMAVPVEATTQNLASFIDLEMEE